MGTYRRQILAVARIGVASAVIYLPALTDAATRLEQSLVPTFP